MLFNDEAKIFCVRLINIFILMLKKINMCAINLKRWDWDTSILRGFLIK